MNITDTKLDHELQDREEPEMFHVEKTTILGVAETDNTYIIQINKMVLWAFLFVVNYPMIREVFIWAYRLLS
jgi:hypothetical protein